MSAVCYNTIKTLSNKRNAFQLGNYFMIRFQCVVQRFNQEIAI